MKKLIFIFTLLFAYQTFGFNSYIIKTKETPKSQMMLEFGLKQVRPNLFVVSKDLFPLLRSQIEIIDSNPNHFLYLDAIANDLGSDQWGIENKGKGIDASVSKAWPITTGSKDIVVAITDTGIDINHPDLKDNIWQNQMELMGEPGVDDDMNGYIDDIYGWNMALETNDVSDVNRHGTHVAGIVGAKGNNGIGVTGVNWDVSLMAVPFFPKKGVAEVADAIQAIDYAIDNGANVINASWGAAYKKEDEEEYSLLKEALTRAEKANVTFVAAAGNSNYNNDTRGHVPASFDNPNIISVGSVTRNGWRSSFSNYGKKSVHVFAPGSTIKSTLPNKYYGNLNGTSMAAPFVAGIIALMLDKNPMLTTTEIKDILLDSCDSNRNLVRQCVCGGHINAKKALEKL